MTESRLKRHRVILVALSFLWLQSAEASPEPTERIEWTQTPIQLHLQVGQERLVHIPSPVKVGVPASIQPLLRTQSVNGTVYFLANAPFDDTRLMVRTIDSGQVFLFDISASDTGGQTHPVEVFLKSDSQTHERQTGTAEPSHQRTPLTSYVALTRFAARQLYAPPRLMNEAPGIVRVPVRRAVILLVRGGAVAATPMVAWRAAGLYLTAVKLTNRTDQPQILDPRDLRGEWLAATFQHHRLLPAGSDADTTAVYLISARPFDVAYSQ